MNNEIIKNISIQEQQTSMLEFIEKSIKKINQTPCSYKEKIILDWELCREEAYKTFLLLYKNERFYDAMIIAGYIFELSSLIHDVTNIKKTDPYDKHFMMYAISNLETILLQCDLPNWKVTPKLQCKYADFIQMLENAIEKIPNETGIKNVDWKGIIVKLKNKNIKNSNKVELLKQNYKAPSINIQITKFLKFMKKKINKTNDPFIMGNENLFRLGYQTYCILKHNGIAAFDLEEAYIKQSSLFLAFCLKYFAS